MTEYSKIASFGGLYFDLSDVQASEAPATLKTRIGQTFVEKQLPMINQKDKVLRISGVITGLSQTSAQTRATAIEADRASLIALDDGYKHAWNDGRHSGNYAIRPGSLRWDDDASRDSGEPYKFTMEVVQWQDVSP